MSVEGTDPNDAADEDTDPDQHRQELADARRVERRCGIDLGVGDPPAAAGEKTGDDEPAVRESGDR